MHSWIHALGDILFRRLGAPRLDDLRRRFLTPEEREAIDRDREDGGL